MQLLVSFFLFILLAILNFFSGVRGSLHITFEYFTQEAKVASLTSRMEALEAESSTLKQNLIDSIGEVAILKEKVMTLSDELRAEC